VTLDVGARLGIDVGTVRIGVARAAAGTHLAVPVDTVRRGAGDLDRLVTLIQDHDVIRVYVGDPLTLAGEIGMAATAVRVFVRQLADRVPDVDVRLVDERLTTAMSGRQMQAAGRSSRSSREFLDQAAAVSILQNAVEIERVTGRPAGQAVGQDNG
jgi:putative Holliday junction resolvase